MVANASLPRRNYRPPEIAEKYRVSTAKVIRWIETGELRALNLAHRGCIRPRYSITPEALADFERARAVLPDCGLAATRRLRRKATPGVREYF